MKRTPNRKPKEPFYLAKVGSVSVPVYRVKAATGYVAFQIPDYTQGRRKLITRSDPRDAKAEADRIAVAQSRQDTAALGLTSKDRASYTAALANLKPTGIVLEVATAQFAEAFKIIGSDRILEAARFYALRNPATLPVRSIADVAVDLVKVRSSATRRGLPASKRYVEDLRARLARLGDAIHKPIAEVTTGDLQTWLDSLDLAPLSKKNFRRVVHTLFAFAAARGFIHKDGNPAKDLEKIGVANGTIAIYTPPEMARLLAAASADFLPCILLGGFAGLRSAEIERLDWSAIDLKDKTVTVSVTESKTGGRRIVPMAQNLADWLAPYAEHQGPIWKGLHDAFYDAQEATIEAANQLADKKGRALPKMRWKANALRHSFATYRLAEIGDAGRVATELGNSRGMVHKHYAELAKPAVAAAWFSISPKAAENLIPMSAAVNA